jgi:predicted acylesterase/phospholipase RssA/CRP-like cAMP-binding protein
MPESPSSPSPSDIASHFAALAIFKAFDAATLEEVAAEVAWIRLRAGETLFRQGEHADSMYVIMRGRLRVLVDQPDGTLDIVEELGAGACAGEMALLSGRPRSATITAIDDAELAQLGRAGFDRLAEKNPTAMRQFAAAMLPRFQQNALAGALAALFGSLSEAVLDELQAEFEWLHLRSGETLFEQGDPSDALYLLVNGRLMITARDPDHGAMVVGEVSRGESVGEAGLLTGEPRSATAYAVRDTDIVRLSQASFERLIERHPRAMMQLVRLIVRRTRPNVGAVALKGNTVAAFAVLPGGRDVPLADFAQRLARALESFGPTLYLNSDRLDTLVGKAGVAQTPEDHPTNFTLTSWLSEQETKHHYIVYQADHEWSEWTSRCVRQTDRTLIVARADSDPRLGRVETAIEGMRAAGHKELVLLQPESRRRPYGTQAWLAPRDVVAHHHVRLRDDELMARLARRLTGRAMGLALGGGGARGLSHIGVIRALEEAGLDIDLVGGTSIGGFVGATYAMGLDFESMARAAKTFSSRKHFADYTVPIVAFFSSRKVTTVLQAMFGDVCIEDLWRPYFCISSNLTRARPMIHRQGLLWKYVRATIALPAIFTPISDQGELLVDGGVMNNLPIDVMRTLSEGGPVVAVNVSLERDPGSNYSFGPSVSGWQVLSSRIRRQPLNVPSLFASLLRTMEINEVHSRKAKLDLADLLIAPPISEFSLLEFDAWEQIIDVGYRAGQEAIAAWKNNPMRATALKDEG